MNRKSSGSGASRLLLLIGGWAAFLLGWLGVFLPGLPTTIFWILSAMAFLRTNRRMYGRIVSHPRFGQAVRLFVEEGRVSPRGKWISIVSMLGFASIGAALMPRLWLSITVLGSAALGSLWVACLPSVPRAAVADAQATNAGQG